MRIAATLLLFLLSGIALGAGAALMTWYGKPFESFRGLGVIAGGLALMLAGFAMGVWLCLLTLQRLRLV